MGFDILEYMEFWVLSVNLNNVSDVTQLMNHYNIPNISGITSRYVKLKDVLLSRQCLNR